MKSYRIIKNIRKFKTCCGKSSREKEAPWSLWHYPPVHYAVIDQPALLDIIRFRDPLQPPATYEAIFSGEMACLRGDNRA